MSLRTTTAPRLLVLVAVKMIHEAKQDDVYGMDDSIWKSGLKSWGRILAVTTATCFVDTVKKTAQLQSWEWVPVKHCAELATGPHDFVVFNKQLR